MSNMARFSDLANELIIEVWRYVIDPKAVENFALTSKQIYAQGSSFISEHNDLKARFSSIAHRYHDGSRPADTLKELILNPRTALYVQKIFVDGWSGFWDEADDPYVPEGTHHRPYSDETIELFREAIRRSPFIPRCEVKDWIEDLECGDEDVIHSLIVTLLPNVHSLKLFRIGISELRLSNTIRRIAESQSTRILSRLKEVQLCGGYDRDREMQQGGGYDVVSGDIDWLPLFSALPSVKVIEALCIGHRRDCSDDSGIECPSCGENHGFMYGPWPDLFILPARSSAVTHLTFHNSDINTERLITLLEGLQALESFDYLVAHTTTGFYGPQDIVNALYATAKRSLHTLRLTTKNHYSLGTVDLAKLVDFEVLKEIDTQSDLLLSYNQPHLIDMMPPSIEKLNLRRVYTMVAHSIENEVLKMAVYKAERFPNLKELTIELQREDAAIYSREVFRAKQKCEEFGVLLNVTIT